MPKLSMKWPVDLKGYEIKYDLPERSTPAARTIAGSAMRRVIVRKKGDLGYYDPFARDGLLHRLASCRKKAEALDFVHQHGLLMRSDSEDLSNFFKEVKFAHELVVAKDLDKSESLYKLMSFKSKAIRLKPVLLEGNPPSLFFAPTTLVDAIYLQFFEEVATRANLKLCQRPGCGEWFKYGPGTLHRVTAQYCSPRCQKAHAYTMSKEGR
jgi:hypothetical protein